MCSCARGCSSSSNYISSCQLIIFQIDWISQSVTVAVDRRRAQVRLVAFRRFLHRPLPVPRVEAQAAVVLLLRRGAAGDGGGGCAAATAAGAEAAAVADRRTPGEEGRVVAPAELVEPSAPRCGCRCRCSVRTRIQAAPERAGTERSRNRHRHLVTAQPSASRPVNECGSHREQQRSVSGCVHARRASLHDSSRFICKHCPNSLVFPPHRLNRLSIPRRNDC